MKFLQRTLYSCISKFQQLIVGGDVLDAPNKNNVKFHRNYGRIKPLPYRETFDLPLVGRGFTPAVENNVTLLLFMCENIKHEAVVLEADLLSQAYRHLVFVIYGIFDRHSRIEQIIGYRRDV